MRIDFGQHYNLEGYNISPYGIPFFPLCLTLKSLCFITSITSIRIKNHKKSNILLLNHSHRTLKWMEFGWMDGDRWIYATVAIWKYVTRVGDDYMGNKVTGGDPLFKKQHFY